MRDVDTPAPTPLPRPIAPTRPSDEIARLGDEIYERHIRARVEADHHGEIVSIDVDSGTWAVGDDILDAVDRLRAQCPEAIDVWSLRVGCRAVHRFGSRSLGIAR
ncbi:MAG: hypothetical protein J4G06_05865 [Caldilineaceae bacterium]|nr:hypothetical protein [Caldilineaceae bacterium]